MLGLNELSMGQRATVRGFRASERSYRQKLLAMGITPGVVITLTRVAPLGDPVELAVRGYAVSLRKAEAAVVLIEPLEEIGT